MALPWRTRDGYAFRVKAHITLQEARALRRPLLELAAASSVPRRVVIFIDSAVCVGAFSKGRSSSFRLNGILRSVAGHLLAANLEASLVWVSTGANPADFPSRDRPLPFPSRAPSAFRDFPDFQSQACISALRYKRRGVEIFGGRVFWREFSAERMGNGEAD